MSSFGATETTVSVIIPVLNEQSAIGDTLAQLSDQDGIGEVLVVDGGSADATRQIAHSRSAQLPGFRWLESEPGRAIQQNTGALIATGDWLLFLHADTRLPPGATAGITALPSSAHFGCFRHRFASTSPLLKLASRLNNIRTRLTRVAYGDQAMFVRREAFIASGMFPVQAMEDVQFSLTMQKAHSLTIIDQAVLTDARKFDQIGHWRALWWASRILWRFRHGRDVADHPFFKNYR